MLCVICLRNNADTRAVCGNCRDLDLPNCNKHVEDVTSKKLAELPSDRQIKIIKLTHHRFHSLLEYNLSREFTLNLVLKEYLDMENIYQKTQNKEDDLDMPMDTNFQNMNRQSYHQYIVAKKEQK